VAHHAHHRQVLVVDPRINRIGYASFNGELLGFGTKSPRNGEPKDRVVRQVIPTVVLLLDQFEPDVLLLPRHGKSRLEGRGHVETVIKAVTAEARRRDIAVHCFSEADVRYAFRDTEGRPARSRSVIDRAIAERYPVLQRYLPKNRRRYDPIQYYRPLFNAFALHGAYEDLQKSQ
jgi:hypothetical protein